MNEKCAAKLSLASLCPPSRSLSAQSATPPSSQFLIIVALLPINPTDNPRTAPSGTGPLCRKNSRTRHSAHSVAFHPSRIPSIIDTTYSLHGQLPDLHHLNQLGRQRRQYVNSPLLPSIPSKPALPEFVCMAACCSAQCLQSKKRKHDQGRGVA